MLSKYNIEINDEDLLNALLEKDGSGKAEFNLKNKIVTEFTKKYLKEIAEYYVQNNVPELSSKAFHEQFFEGALSSYSNKFTLKNKYQELVEKKVNAVYEREEKKLEQYIDDVTEKAKVEIVEKIDKLEESIKEFLDNKLTKMQRYMDEDYIKKCVEYRVDKILKEALEKNNKMS